MEALPYGATRAADLVPQVLCMRRFAGGPTSVLTFSASSVRNRPIGGVRCQDQTPPPTIIGVDKLEARIQEVLAAVANTTGHQRKSSVADNFNGFVRARKDGVRGWKTATDVDLFEWLFWLDSQGNGTKLVHATTCPGVGTDGRTHPLLAERQMLRSGTQQPL